MQLFVLHIVSSFSEHRLQLEVPLRKPEYSVYTRIQALRLLSTSQNLPSHCPCPWPAPSAMELAFAWARLLFSPCLPFYITRRLIPLL